jgi:hypothetical protein
MARENQGLQIALIIFVMLTIILGVTTYLFFRQYEDANNKAKANLDEHAKVSRQLADSTKDLEDLKQMIGAKGEKVDKITNEIFNEDMKKYGGAYPEETRVYHQLIEKMANTINEKNNEVAEVKARIAKLEEDFRVREANKQPQIDDFKKAAADAGKDLAGERTKFKTERDRLTQDEARLQSDLDAARKQGKAATDAIDEKLYKANQEKQKLIALNKGLTEKQEQLTAQKFDVPNGEIRWVNQRTGTVWIDLGRADALQRQITFAVYPSDISDMTVGGKKGSIEVTQILGDHLAEAHISDDKMIDPIVPGDKIFTPVWAPGEKRHFALAGWIDLDGDGKSDMLTVRDLITANGGVVDCYVDDKGKKVGDMTVNTRYLVHGEAPSDRSNAAILAPFTKMQDQASRLGIQKLQLPDLLQRMGWKNQTSVVRYGPGANPKDFAAKPDDGPQKKSTGVVSDVFKPRTPPARVPSSAY